MNRLTRLVGTVAALVLLCSGCPAEEETTSDHASSPLKPVACPRDVRTSVVGPLECARLSVPESRSQKDSDHAASDRRINVFVAIVRASADGTSADPMLVAPGTGTPLYSGIAPLAQRVGRDVIFVDGRGVAHSEPALDCPGVDSAVPDAWSRPTGDPAVTARLRDAVAACHEELTATGVDVMAYDTTESAADLVDLREALGVEQWNLISYGAPSRVALELLRQDPSHVRSLVMDSPEIPGTDPRELAPTATERAVRGVLQACAHDPACRSEHPGAPSLLDDALASLAAEPIQLTGPGTAPLLDPGLLIRGLRESLSNSGVVSPDFAIGTVPGLLEDVVAGRRNRLGRAFRALTQYGSPTCVGYRATCKLDQHTYFGTAMTRLCRDIAPFAIRSERALGPGFDELFETSPYWELCGAWPVPPADAQVYELPRWEGPVLVVLGDRDPYAITGQVRRDLAGLTAASYLVTPARGHNAMPAPCVGNLRNAWVDDPAPFRDNPCAQEAITWTD